MAGMFCITGPLRATAVLLLLGLTWLLANTLLGGESGSSVRHFFSGKKNDLKAAAVGRAAHFI